MTGLLEEDSMPLSFFLPRAVALGLAATLAAIGCSQNPGSGDGGDGANNNGDAPTLDGSMTDAGAAEGGDLDALIDANEATSLAIDPTMATLRITDLATPLTQAFTARAHTMDGRDVVVSPDWSVDRTDVLTIDAAGLATTTNSSGGDVLVTAHFGSLTATATVRVIVDVPITLPDTPGDIASLFPPGAAPTTNAMRTPSFVYPANQTIFPQNVYKVLFQWRPGGNDRFRINIDSDRVHLVLYTAGQNATCTMAGTGLSCFEPTLDVWRFIAASNPHGTVTITIDGALSTAPGMFYRSAPLTIGFSRGPVPGAIYYWSTTAQGVRRATVSDAAPTNFLTPSETNGACVACHTLSRRGNRMAADVGGNNLWVVEVSPTFPPPRLVTRYNGANIPYYWATFSFDETRIITAARGVMTLRNTADGAPINTAPLGAMHFGTQPDWAPDGTLVAFAYSTTTRDRGVASARIATIESMPGDAWGTVRMLAGNGTNTDTNQFPSFSWDSQWIAYTHSTGNGENDNTTDLWLMGRDGSMPRALTTANTVVNDTTVTTATIEDSMSTWAPSGVPDDYAWIAFTSNRDYGGVLSRASHFGQRKQLWVTAIDLTRAASGADVSAPAFRLPFTELAENTHRPFWAEDRVIPMPDGGVDAGTDAGTGTDASMDAGPDAGTMCVPLHGDCTSGMCCDGLTCWDDGSGNFTCENIPM
jgi:hypothetical protein